MNAEKLDAEHEEYDGPRLAKLRALHEGGKPWHTIAKSGDASSWFPRRWAEPEDVYTERQAMLGYNNHAGGIVEMFAALLFAEPPTIDGLPASEFYGGFIENVDGKSSSWSRWWRERVLDALIGKRAYAWVNAPARPEGVEFASLADEQLAGALDLFLVGLKPEQVINWAEDEAGRLSAVMVKDRRVEWTGPDTGNVTMHRWRYIDGTQIRTWEWKATKGKPLPNDKDDVPELAAITHNIGRIPVVRLELSPGLWAMGKLEDPAVSATRARNEYTWALHQAANELLTLTSKGQDSLPTLGHGHYLQLTRDSDGADEAKYVAPTGTAFEYLQKDVVDTRDELFRVVQQMAMSVDQDASRVRQSGESKAQDWKALEVILVSLAAPVLVAMTETLGVIVRARRDKAAPTVSGLDNWQLEDVLTFLENVALADPFVKSETWSKTVGKRAAQRILGDEVDAETMTTIEKEVDEADYDPPMFAPQSLPLDDETEEEDAGDGED